MRKLLRFAAVSVWHNGGDPLPEAVTAIDNCFCM